MKSKTNMKLLGAIRDQGLRQVDLVQSAELSSESRLSRIIRNRAKATNEETDRICNVLGLLPKDIGLEGDSNG